MKMRDTNQNNPNRQRGTLEYYIKSRERARAPTQGLCYCRVQSANNFSVSLFTFVTWDRAQLVGLNIPLRSIFKPSYSGNITKPNVVGHLVYDNTDNWTKDIDKVHGNFGRANPTTADNYGIDFRTRD